MSIPKICFSDAPQGRFGISGHVGVGHVHSHSGFVQDDSAGFAVASSILKRALPADTSIREASADPGTGEITVVTGGGGTGTAAARRGVTPSEAELIAQRAPGLDAAFCQTTAVQVFGRLYGQGAAETAVAFEGACALAALDTFLRAAPERFHRMTEVLPGRRDTAAAAVLDIGGVPVALMLVINFTEGGIGPDEDYEGNTSWGDKGRMMREVGLDRIPTAVLECKAYIPALAGGLDTARVLIRAQAGVDHMALAKALQRSAEAGGIACLLRDDLMPVAPGSLQAATAAFADQVIEQARRLKEIDTAADKVRILAELNRLVSEDAGGVTFMGNTVNDAARGAGLLPDISAVVSMVVPKAYRDRVKIPMLTPEDALLYERVVLGGILNLAKTEDG